MGAGVTMENLLIMATAVVALVLGGWGIGKVCYERGYVHGFDDAENGDDIVLTIEDDG